MILILIDGLGYRELNLAVRKGYCPFLKKLLKKGHRLHPYYCGPPAATTATEAELFYGSRANIPGFTWYDRILKRFVRGNRGSGIGAFERFFSKRSELLKNGSCLLGVYSGGASQLNVSGKDLDGTRPLRLLQMGFILFLVLLNPVRLVYTLYLVLKSLTLSFIMLFRAKSPRHLRQTFKDSLARIFLGNIATYVAELELFRETPILFIDYVLYDEFAHEYGMGSKTARSSLRLINWYCQSLYKMSGKTKRTYDFLVFSDHGQTKSLPFEGLNTGVLERLIKKSVGNTSYIPLKTFGITGALKDIEKKVYLVPAGSTLQVYFSDTLEKPLNRHELTRRFPHFEETLLRDSQIGWLLIRINDNEQILLGKKGNILFRDGSVEKISGDPFPHMQLDARIPSSLAKYATFANNGDVVIFGNEKDGKLVAFEQHKSTHGGFAGEMTQPFVITDIEAVLNRLKTENSMKGVFDALRECRASDRL